MLIHCNVYMNLKNMGKLWALLPQACPTPFQEECLMRAAVLRLLLLLLTVGSFTKCYFTTQPITKRLTRTATVSMGGSLTSSMLLGIAAAVTNFEHS